MTLSDMIDEVNLNDITLVEAFLGHDIYVKDEYAGAIEGIPGRLEYIVLEQHWEGKGVARATLNKFIILSEKEGHSKLKTNNAVHPAMEHILKTEGFEQHSTGWEKKIR